MHSTRQEANRKWFFSFYLNNGTMCFINTPLKGVHCMASSKCGGIYEMPERFIERHDAFCKGKQNESLRRSPLIGVRMFNVSMAWYYPACI